MKFSLGKKDKHYMRILAINRLLGLKSRICFELAINKFLDLKSRICLAQYFVPVS